MKFSCASFRFHTCILYFRSKYINPFCIFTSVSVLFIPAPNFPLRIRFIYSFCLLCLFPGLFPFLFLFLLFFFLFLILLSVFCLHLYFYFCFHCDFRSNILQRNLSLLLGSHLVWSTSGCEQLPFLPAFSTFRGIKTIFINATKFRV